MEFTRITDNIIVYLGDSRDILPLLIDKYLFKLCLTDPPYGIGYQSQHKSDKSQWFDKIANDDKPFVEWIPHVKPLLLDNGALYVFYRWDVQHPFYTTLSEHFDVKSQIVWNKIIHGMGDLKSAYGPQHENILFAIQPHFEFVNKRPRSVITQRRVRASDLVHPNEKPVALLEKLIEDSTNKGDLVLDPFMGSGTTGRACARTGRGFVGIDVSREYYELSIKQIKNELRQPKLL